MKQLLLEIYYRSAYIFITICFIECLAYFIVGIQLEYFSGLFFFNYQTIEFGFCEDVSLQIILKRKSQVLFEEKALFCSYPFFSLTTNEAKAWFYLFILYLSYFHCVELNKIILYYLLTYTKIVHVIIFIIGQSWGIFLPGLLQMNGLRVIFVVLLFPLVTAVFNQQLFLLVVSSVKELQLEPLDSELI